MIAMKVKELLDRLSDPAFLEDLMDGIPSAISILTEAKAELETLINTPPPTEDSEDNQNAEN